MGIQQRIVMWSIPRSRSTAFERAVMQRRDTEVHHELLASPYAQLHTPQLHDQVAVSRCSYGLPEQTQSYDEVLRFLSQTDGQDGTRHLFTKELISSFDEALISDEWLAKFRHVFLVREPLSALKSLYRVSGDGPTTYFDPAEIDFEKMDRVYARISHVCPREHLMVIDGDDDLIDDTTGALQRFCAFAQMDFDPAMTSWEPAKVDTWQVWKGWHDDAEKSSAFQATNRSDQEIPAEIEAEILARAEAASSLYFSFAATAGIERCHFKQRSIMPFRQAQNPQGVVLLEAGPDLPNRSKFKSLAPILDRFSICIAHTAVLAKRPQQEIAREFEALSAPFFVQTVDVAGANSGLPQIKEILRQACGSLPVWDLPHDTKIGYEDFISTAMREARDMACERVLRFNRKNRTVGRRFRWQCELPRIFQDTSGRSILSDGSENLSGREWGLKAAAVANAVTEGEVDPFLQTRDWVVLLGGRGGHTATVMAGCLMAGKPFLEIPAWYNDDIIKDILSRLSSTLILAESDQVQRARQLGNTLNLSAIVPAQEACLTGWLEDLERRPDSLLAHGALTSGTTSAAKIVAVPDSQVLDSLGSWKPFIRPGDRVGLNAWISCYVFYPALCEATTVIIPDPVITDPVALCRFVLTEGLTQVMVTPTLLEGLLGLGMELAESFAAVHTVWISGETMPAALWGKARKVLKNARFIDLLGINETGDVGLAHEPGGKFTLLDGLEAYVYDAEGNLVPDGSVGELFLSGPGLSCGYIGDEEASHRAIVSNPLGSTHPGLSSNLYRSGDLVKAFPDGRIQFQGRVSSRLKIRGYSVNTKNIEHVLAAHPDVKSALVLTRGEGARTQLVAYIVPLDRETKIGARNVRGHCQRLLPTFAVPSAFYAIPQMPIAGSMKRGQDRSQVLEAAVPLSDDAMSYAGDQRRIAEIWKSVLGGDLPMIAPGDSFFDFGGSLQLLELQQAMKAAMGYEIPIDRIYQRPTLSGMAELVDEARSGQAADAITPFDLEGELKQFSCENPLGKRSLKVVNPKPKVLLTGATGFLGRYVLANLLENWDLDTIYCLVRGSSQAECEQRLARNAVVPLEPFFDTAARPRLEIVQGDIAQPELGCSAEVYQMLSRNVDTVIHCAANVNWIRPYADLKSANVVATDRILGLCAASGAALTFISTVPSNGVETGYNQSKIVAEGLCAKWAQECGVRVRVIRCGDIAAPSRTDLPFHLNEDDYINVLLAACLELKAWPCDVGWTVNLTPVDSAAEIIGKLTLAAPEHSGMVLQALSSREHDVSWHDVWKLIGQALPDEGFEGIALEDWTRRLDQVSTASPAISRTRVLLQGVKDDLEKGPDFGGCQPSAFDIPPIQLGYVGRLVHALRSMN